VIQGSVSQSQLYGLPSPIACANMLDSVLIYRVIQKSSKYYRMGHEKVARVRSQQHAIEDGQREGGGEKCRQHDC
jgi:hypothetical protein